MKVFIPIIISSLLVFVFTSLVFRYKFLYALLLNVVYTIAIFIYLHEFSLQVYFQLTNLLFYVMILAGFITRPRFKTLPLDEK